MDLDRRLYRIGDTFTPLEWGEFASYKFGIFEKWINGATVFDPTMGTGNLLESLITIGLKQGFELNQLPIQRLFGNELNSDYYRQALDHFESSYGIDMRNNFSNSDIFTLAPHAYDIIFGNPPWMNFTELPIEYKTALKSIFISYDLAENTQKLLLGGSRIDIAALVVQKSISDFLTPNGNAYFFLPLSILLNDGAHDSFRRYSVKGSTFSLEQVYDFNELPVFSDISTRNGLVHFHKNAITEFPIDYFRYSNGSWIKQKATPILSDTGPLSVFDENEAIPLFNFESIELDAYSKPRQGINTAGANHIFFFSTYSHVDDTTCCVNSSILLPKKFIYPLITSQNFNDSTVVPNKWVLFPYGKNGKPLSLNQLHKHPLLLNYLLKNEEALRNRKGSMIQAWTKRGYWWALLGAGTYNFANYKIVWEAYGRHTFEPRIFKGQWQVNQSLQAFIPTRHKREADRILKALKNPAIERYLLSLKMAGTMNWAQPGKISKLLKITDESSENR